MPESKEYPALTGDQTLEWIKEEMEKEVAIWDTARKEYSNEANTFANFNRIARRLDLEPEQVLMVYATKHFDGILSWVNGIKQQREDISGRISDLRIYMGILQLMIAARRHGKVTTDPEGIHDQS